MPVHATEGYVDDAVAAEATARAADVDAEQAARITAVDDEADARVVGDAAEAAALAAHIGDAAGAHAASAVSISDAAGDFTATDVEGALAELQTDHEGDATALADHIGDASGAHAATAISAAAGGELTGATAQAQLYELDARLAGLPFYSPEFFHDYMVMWDDFISGTAVSGAIGALGWNSATAGTGALTALNTDTGLLYEPGFVQLSASAVNDSAHLFLGSFPVQGSPEYDWEQRVRPNAPASAQDQTIRCGIVDTAIAAPADGAWFEASWNGGNLSWHAKSRNASGTVQSTDTNIDPDVNAWHTLRIMCDGNGALSYFIQGALVATHSTVSAAGATGPRSGILKTVGTSARHLRIGYTYLRVAVPR